MKTNFSIPKPCHENWDTFSPAEKGKFCGVCSKVVMDFSKRSNEEIVDFLKSNSGNRVCGRVSNDQLRIPQVALPIAIGAKPRYKIFLAALYFVFGGILFTSCDTKPKDDVVMGKMEMVDSPPKKNLDSTRTDKMNSTTKFDSAKYLDSIKKMQTSKKVKTKCSKPDSINQYSMHTMGIMVMPEPDTTK